MCADEECADDCVDDCAEESVGEDCESTADRLTVQHPHPHPLHTLPNKGCDWKRRRENIRIIVRNCRKSKQQQQQLLAR